VHAAIAERVDLRQKTINSSWIFCRSVATRFLLWTTTQNRRIKERDVARGETDADAEAKESVTAND